MKEIYGSNDKNKSPLMSGYRYTGKSSAGETSWEKISPLALCIDESKFGSDDGLTPLYDGEMPISDSEELGMRGEKIFTLYRSK